MGDKSMNTREMLDFLRFMNDLKHLKRQGWVLKDIKEPESVAGHMYRMAVMSMVLPENSGLNRIRCMELSLVHDMGESIIGDITPYCGVPRDEKLRREREAIERLATLAGHAGEKIRSLFMEYESQETAEARFVKELDHLDLLLQAREYEEKGHTDLEEFFRLQFSHPTTKVLAEQIMEDHKGDTTNRFFNEHWRDIMLEIRPVLEDTISEVVHAIVRQVFDNFPIEQLLPES